MDSERAKQVSKQGSQLSSMKHYLSQTQDAVHTNGPVKILSISDEGGMFSESDNSTVIDQFQELEKSPSALSDAQTLFGNSRNVQNLNISAGGSNTNLVKNSNQISDPNQATCGPQNPQILF